MKIKKLTIEEIHILKSIIDNLIYNPGVSCIYLNLLEDLNIHKEFIYVNIITDTKFYLEKLCNNEEKEYCLSISKLNAICIDYEKYNIRIKIRDLYDYNLSVNNNRELEAEFSLGTAVILFDKYNIYKENQSIAREYFNLSNSVIIFQNIEELLSEEKVIKKKMIV